MSALHVHARQRGLTGTTDFNLGVEGDYRIPDGGLHLDDSDAIYVGSAPLIVEVLSPDDETMEKLPFYASRGVEEVVIVDPVERCVTWLRLVDGSYEPAARSDLLGIDVDAVAGRIDWPPVDS